MVVGRAFEIKQLQKSLNSKESEFIAVYGRRRIGKTYLVREFFSSKDCVFFYTVGQYRKPMAHQIKNFSTSLSETFLNNAPIRSPKNWDDAFQLLHSQIIQAKGKVVLFLDELPWLVTAKSGLMSTIEYYWNRYWQQLGNVILVVCGSSASWIVKNIIQNKGGLHNRLTQKIKLKPFSLQETKEFLRTKKIKLNEDQITKIYMAIGGIPFYLKLLEPGMTAAQMIQALFFSEAAPLQQEFSELFKSMFKNSKPYIELIRLISKKRNGTSLKEIREKIKLTSLGGHLSERLNELVEAGFISENVFWGKKHGEFYKLVDEFCLFYLKWVAPVKKKELLPSYWENQASTQAYKVWSGYAFEALCMKHLPQITHALKIKSGGVFGSWAFKPSVQSEAGVQVDLLIDRLDGAITLCEIKYYDQPFKIDKTYAKKLLDKIKSFEKNSKTDKQIFMVMIVSKGLAPSVYNEDVVDGVVTLKALFDE